MSILMGVLVFVSVICLAGAVIDWRRPQPLNPLDTPLDDGPARLFDPAMAVENVVNLLSRIVGRRAPTANSDIEPILQQAGYPFGIKTAEQFNGIRWGGALTFALIAWMLTIIASNLVAFFALLGAAGFYLYCEKWVESQAEKRTFAIEGQLTDMLDLMAVVFSAGVDFTNAWRYVASEIGGPIGEEMQVVGEQLQAGSNRDDALRVMIERVPSERLHQVLETIIQAQYFGVGLSTTLREQSEQLRNLADLRAEEAAGRAEMALYVPLFLFFLVPIGIILVYPKLTGGGGGGGMFGF